MTGLTGSIPDLKGAAIIVPYAPPNRVAPAQHSYRLSTEETTRYSIRSRAAFPLWRCRSPAINWRFRPGCGGRARAILFRRAASQRRNWGNWCGRCLSNRVTANAQANCKARSGRAAVHAAWQILWRHIWLPGREEL